MAAGQGGVVAVDKTLGRIAYDAYWLERDGTDPEHSVYLTLTSPQKAAWEAAGQAVAEVPR